MASTGPLALGLLKRFCVGSTDWHDYGSRNHTQPAAAVEAVLPPSYLGSQRGDQMDAREEEMHSDRY